MTTNTIPQCESRIDSSELRLMAERDDVNGMPQYAQALRQAADDAERLERAESLLAKCPKATTTMYVGHDSISYGDQVKTFLAERTPKEQTK